MRRFLKLCMVGGAVIAMGILAAAQIALPPGAPKPEKIEPLNFHLDPTSPLYSGLAAKIEATNAELTMLMSRLRLGDIPSPDMIRKHFEGTYLAEPVLWDEGGKVHDGWFGENGVLSYLAKLVKGSSFIHPQGVHVYLKYLPFGSAEFSKANPTLDLMKIDKAAWANAIDFLVDIRTVLAYSPYDDSNIIGNKVALDHRTICWKQPGE